MPWVESNLRLQTIPKSHSIRQPSILPPSRDEQQDLPKRGCLTLLQILAPEINIWSSASGAAGVTKVAALLTMTAEGFRLEQPEAGFRICTDAKSSEPL